MKSKEFSYFKVGADQRHQTECQTRPNENEWSWLGMAQADEKSPMRSLHQPGLTNYNATDKTGLKSDMCIQFN